MCKHLILRMYTIIKIRKGREAWFNCDVARGIMALQKVAQCQKEETTKGKEAQIDKSKGAATKDRNVNMGQPVL